MRGDNVPVIFGIKLKQIREERGLNLKRFAELTGLSPSYLNEIEKGKKYPKADKILQIAQGLGVSYDELVSLKLEHGLNPLGTVLDSPVFRELPLQVFGISQQDVVNLITKAPKKAVALVHALDEITRSYDMRVEHFFYAMLRSYQEAHDNCFEEIEAAVLAFLEGEGFSAEEPIRKERLAEILADRYGVAVDEQALDGYPELQGFRSVWVQGRPERLLVNGRLSEEQKTFQLGREIGYRVLELKERGVTSSRAEVTSFEQVLNDFKASYFAGAVMIRRERLEAELARFFQRKRWNAEAFLAIKQGYGVTPEMFLYRLTQIIPSHFHLDQYYFLRFNAPADGNGYHLTKQFNMSPALFPTGIEQHEHYCRRWLAVDILRELNEGQRQGPVATPIIGAQVSHFLNGEADYFVISLARPLALTPGTNTSVTLGFRITDAFKAAVGFWNDPALPRKVINETCERCPLSSEECTDRAAPFHPEKLPGRPDVRKQALERLFAEVGGRARAAS